MDREETTVKDDRSAIRKYLTILLVWLIPVAFILIAVLYPVEDYLRDILVLPIIVVLLYVAFLISPMFSPLKNVDYFDEIPAAIERFVESQRTRKDARDLIRLYHDGTLPNVYELPDLTRFQKDVLRIAEFLRADAGWHGSNQQVSQDLLDRMEQLMGLRKEELDEAMTTPLPKPRHRPHRSK